MEGGGEKGNVGEEDGGAFYSFPEVAHKFNSFPCRPWQWPSASVGRRICHNAIVGAKSKLVFV